MTTSTTPAASLRRLGAIVTIAGLLLLAPASAFAQVDVLTDDEPVVPLPTTTPTVDDVLPPLDEEDPLPVGNVDPARTVDGVLEGAEGGDEPGSGGSGSGGTGGGGTGSSTSGGTGSRGASNGAGSTTGSTKNTIVDGTAGPGEAGTVSLAPPKSYTTAIGDGAFATAERAVRLARPLAPPLIIAGFALAILIAVARGNDRLVHVEQKPEKRTYRL